MPSPFLKTTNDIVWVPSRLSNRFNLSAQQKKLCLNVTSLTAYIRQSCPQMRVEVLSERWGRPQQAEAKRLGIPANRLVWIRSVLLHCDNRPLVFARTVVPNLKPGNTWFGLKKLNNRPLGEILFSDKRIRRSAFLIGKQPGTPPSGARQSLFTKQGDSLLLTELFIEENF